MLYGKTDIDVVYCVLIKTKKCINLVIKSVLTDIVRKYMLADRCISHFCHSVGQSVFKQCFSVLQVTKSSFL